MEKKFSPIKMASSANCFTLLEIYLYKINFINVSKATSGHTSSLHNTRWFHSREKLKKTAVGKLQLPV